ncbi:hypothetical protein [Agrobacterium cavarae]|uniref:hypothetical protein n=2 Tax=Agrobacterium cavarae TaxID=2528239 RepID=UPI003FD3C765
MPLSVARELKKSVGDQLRGVRHLVRLLGSDVQRPHLAPPVLPSALPEVDRILGKTFRAVDNVMSAVETTVRPPATTFCGFSPLEDYALLRPHDALQEDIYRGLKATVAVARSNELILKSRLAAVEADVMTGIVLSHRREERSAVLLRSLVRRGPLVDVCGDMNSSRVLKQYIALALLLGLANRGRLSEEEASSLVEDAFLLANTRVEIIGKSLIAGKADSQLLSTLGILLDHLA